LNWRTFCQFKQILNNIYLGENKRLTSLYDKFYTNQLTIYLVLAFLYKKDKFRSRIDPSLLKDSHYHSSYDGIATASEENANPFMDVSSSAVSEDFGFCSFFVDFNNAFAYADPSTLVVVVVVVGGM
jgi:hypothetical protein